MLKILLWDLGTQRDEINEPLGIEMLAGALENQAAEFAVDLRWENATRNGLAPDLKPFAMVGLSVKLGTLPLLTRIIETVRNLSRQPVVLLGDVLPTFAFREILALFPEVICVVGEGETALRALVRSIVEPGRSRAETLSRIPNLAFMSQGTLVLTKRFQEDPKALLKPDRRFVDWTLRQGGILRIEGSRGCGWSRCQFCCVKSKYGAGGWRPFPISHILDQLAELSSAGVRGPYFTDEDFLGGDTERALSLAESIIHAKRDGAIAAQMSFLISARTNDIASCAGERALDALKRAGLREVFVGVESGSSAQLRRYGKRVTPDLNKHALGVLRKLGLQIDIGYILFEPETTFDELKINAQYLYELDLVDHYSRSIKDLRVQPLTGLAEKYARKGIISGALDLNTLRYPARYTDERVAWVRDKFVEFETEGMEEIYSLQSLCRGEAESDQIRLSAKKRLGRIRQIDLDQLSTLIAYASREIDEQAMRRLTDNHRKSRIRFWRPCQQAKKKCVASGGIHIQPTQQPYIHNE
jgi:hypothetical protein